MQRTVDSGQMGLLERIQQYVLTNTSNKKYTFVFAPKYIHNTFLQRTNNSNTTICKRTANTVYYTWLILKVPFNVTLPVRHKVMNRTEQNKTNFISNVYIVYIVYKHWYIHSLQTLIYTCFNTRDKYIVYKHWYIHVSTHVIHT